MGKGYRQGRLGEEIRRIVSEMLINGIKDPRLAGKMLSVSGVSVTRDGSYATCYLSLLAGTQDAEAKQQAEDEDEFDEDDGYGEGFDPDEAYGKPEYLSEDGFEDSTHEDGE